MAPPSEEQFQKRLGYVFQSPALLSQALHHASLSKVQAASPFERLEFLGDRVLSLVMAQWLYTLHPLETEGLLAVRHSALVQRTSLLAVGKGLALESVLRYDQQKGPPRLREKILADSVEALLGALFLDGGLKVTQERIQAWWAPLVAAQNTPPVNVKSLLQEWAQGQGMPPPTYRVCESSGPAHQPFFTVEVEVEGHPTFKGTGASKKEAEMVAAKSFWDFLQDTADDS